MDSKIIFRRAGKIRFRRYNSQKGNDFVVNDFVKFSI